MDDWLYIVLMFVNVVRAYVSEESTLTTASFKELSPPIPTMMMNRRMGNQEEDFMLRARSKPQQSLRRPPSEGEWGWDKWCLMQPKPGNCKEKQSLFYYDTQIDECREFVYTGCYGNQNRFGTRKECEQFCKGFGMMVMEVKSLTQLESCSLQPDPGMCLASIGRYFFDIATRKCRPFIFGGCGGNSNRFLDEETCLEKCAAVSG